LTAEEKRQKISELKKKIDVTQAEYDRAKAMQLALKLVINGTYGAFAHPKFVLSNSHIANAITAMGRDVIQYMLDKIEQYFYEEWHLDTVAHSKLGIEYVGEKGGEFFLLDKGGNNLHYPHPTYQDLTNKLNIYDFNKIENFKINGYEIQYSREIFDFSGENITQISREDPMIIYGDTDSLYVTFEPVMRACGFKGNELDFILHLDRVMVKDLFKKYLDEYGARFGVKNIHDFELETVNRSALHIQKKHYINNVAWEDGIFYENLSYFYPKGVEIVKSSTPPFVRENIYDFLRYLFGNPNNLNIRKILQLVKDMKRQFMMANLEDISMTTSCSNYEVKVLDDVTDCVTVKGAHFGVKAAAFHNYLLNKNSEYKVRYDMIKGGRIKYYYCNSNKAERFAYLRSFHPTEITEKENVKVDYDTQFDKTFLTIVNRFLNPIGLPTINKRLSVLNSIFQV
jgi:DNA polymerase elongation subunit (family B)